MRFEEQWQGKMVIGDEDGESRMMRMERREACKWQWKQRSELVRSKGSNSERERERDRETDERIPSA